MCRNKESNNIHYTHAILTDGPHAWKLSLRRGPIFTLQICVGARNSSEIVMAHKQMAHPTQERLCHMGTHICKV